LASSAAPSIRYILATCGWPRRRSGHLGLGGVRWIPAGQPPHRGNSRKSPPAASGDGAAVDRENARFSVDASEVEAAAPSYTVHTLERLRAELGSDSRWSCWSAPMPLPD
jgi:nicotinic acid mononucleotide adenylyltransferase